MAETAVEDAVCKRCGVDIRDESLFCYNCGASVAAGDRADGDAVEERHLPEKPPADARPPLRSAASLRKHRRAMNRQPVEISWEQPQGSPTMFFVATVVLTVGALILLFLALYLR